MLAASDDDSAMQHVQAAASETSKTSETSVPAVRPLRSALLADPAALMCRPFPPLQSWGCIPRARRRKRTDATVLRKIPAAKYRTVRPRAANHRTADGRARKSVSAGPAAATAVLSPANVLRVPLRSLAERTAAVRPGILTCGASSICSVRYSITAAADGSDG